MVKKPTITETVRLNRFRWLGYVQRMEENRIPKKVLYMNLETTMLRGRWSEGWWETSWFTRVEGKGILTERNGRCSWEWQGIVTFCTCQWNQWMNRQTLGFWRQVSSTPVDVDCFNIVYTVHHISHQFYLSTVNAHYLWANHFVTITLTLWCLFMPSSGSSWLFCNALKWHNHLLIVRSQLFLYKLHLIVKYTQYDSNMCNIKTINLNWYFNTLRTGDADLHF